MGFFKDMYFRARPFALYGFALAVLVFVLKWLQWKFLIVDNSLDIYIGLIALFFTGLGIWVASQLTRRKVEVVVEQVVVEKVVPVESGSGFVPDAGELERLGLSARELEVLGLIVQGKSNAEIADCLCLSVSTVKTHASNLFAKLGVRSRTQAIQEAKRLRITA